MFKLNDEQRNVVFCLGLVCLGIAIGAGLMAAFQRDVHFTWGSATVDTQANDDCKKLTKQNADLLGRLAQSNTRIDDLTALVQASNSAKTAAEEERDKAKAELASLDADIDLAADAENAGEVIVPACPIERPSPIVAPPSCDMQIDAALKVTQNIARGLHERARRCAFLSRNPLELLGTMSDQLTLCNSEPVPLPF